MDGTDDYPFGFTIQRPGAAARSFNTEKGDWAILLPHSCDEWVIASGPDRDEVLAQAQRFRAELDEAMVRLAAAD